MATGLTAPSVYILSKAKTIGDHIWPSCLCSLQEISSCSIPKVLFFWGGTLKQFRACMEANIKSVCTGHTVYSILGVLHLAVLKYHLHTHTHIQEVMFSSASRRLPTCPILRISGGGGRFAAEDCPGCSCFVARAAWAFLAARAFSERKEFRLTCVVSATGAALAAISSKICDLCSS